MRSISSRLTSSLRRSYRPVVREDSWAAICCAISSRPPFLGRVMPVARNV